MKSALFPRSPYFGFALFAAAILCLPFLIHKNYYLSVLIVIGINTIIVLGLDLLMGYTGQISLGHSGFFGLGAYITGILSVHWHWTPLAGLPMAIGGVCLVALFIGIPTLKLHGHYLAMATLGFGIILFIVFSELLSLTGGPSGLNGISPMVIAGYPFDNDRKFYYLVAGCLLLVLLLSINLVRSRVGRALRAISGSEVAAGVLGVDIGRFKVGIFVLSAAYAAIAGWLYSHYITFISPSSFGFMFSVKLVTMVVVGSLGSLWGAVFGAALLTSLPEFLSILHDYEILVFGLILMVVMIFMPRGLLRGVEDIVISVGSRLVRGRAGGKP